MLYAIAYAVCGALIAGWLEEDNLGWIVFLIFLWPLAFAILAGAWVGEKWRNRK